ncbi:MAG: thioesterase family protein [Pseudomonadota bacterium]|nr:thioesterase family protein [Pseudomonadota bacterium]
MHVLLRVRYGECDAQGVMFNARYMDLVDVAFTEFERVVWGGHQVLVNAGLDTQVVSMQIDWTAPAVFDDVLDLELSVDRIGQTSMTLVAGFRRHADAAALAVARVTYVLVNVAQGGKTAIPPWLREALTQQAPDCCIDLAAAGVATP